MNGRRVERHGVEENERMRDRGMEVWSVEFLNKEGDVVIEAEGLGKEVKIITIPSRSSNLLVTNN